MGKRSNMPDEMNEAVNFTGILLALVGTSLIVWWLYMLSWYQCEKMFTSPDRPWRPAKDSDPGQKDAADPAEPDAEVKGLKED